MDCWECFGKLFWVTRGGGGLLGVFEILFWVMRGGCGLLGVFEILFWMMRGGGWGVEGVALLG